MTATTLTDVLPKHEGERLTLLWSPGSLPGCGVAEIIGRKSGTTYTVNEFPTEWSGRAFRMEKLPGDAGTDASQEAYDLFCGTDPRQDRCGCRGFARWHHCKHLDAATTLIANGWL